jgi:F-type H+-transporting ATPase subunit delta
VSVVHRTYARALFEAAQERDHLEQVRRDFTEFVEAIEAVPELRALLENPQLDSRTKSETVEALLGGTDKLVRNFLLITIEKNRAGQLVEIHREFERLVAQLERRLRVELTTAHELSDEEAQRIVEQIERASGRTIEATRSVDPDLIGGVVLTAGAMRVDASVRGRLDRLRRELTTANR